MSEPEPAENGYGRVRPRLPLGIVVASIVIALIAGSALIYVLYKETKGPGEILREFAERVDRGDCAGSYELLDEGVRSGFTEELWCTQTLPLLDEGLDADFTLEHAVLEGDTAEVEISGVELTRWRLNRFGERSWRVVGPKEGLGELLTVGDADIETIP
ncbi:MAG: hypothetical protein ACRDHM_10825 [Actinomycetota bacterium]